MNMLKSNFEDVWIILIWINFVFFFFL